MAFIPRIIGYVKARHLIAFEAKSLDNGLVKGFKIIRCGENNVSKNFGFRIGIEQNSKLESLHGFLG
ncbi:MAG: hypothetical protein EBR54_03395 [Flavobacteriia bacterium]|nr:hypothetical protein [Flavobacteriia bacterium]